MPARRILDTSPGTDENANATGEDFVYLDFEVSRSAWEGMGKPDMEVCGYCNDAHTASLKQKEIETTQREKGCEMAKVHVAKLDIP